LSKFPGASVCRHDALSAAPTQQAAPNYEWDNQLTSFERG